MYLPTTTKTNNMKSAIMPTTILFFWLLVAAAIIFPACHAEQTTTPPMFENCPLNCQNGGACQVVQVVDVSSPARTNNNNNDNNGGESLQQQQQQQEEFYCTCPEAYSGYFCEYNASDDNIIDDDDEEEEEECSLPCYNGGLCEVVFDEWERCLCQDGFYGYSCEYLDESTCPIECVNGGRCTSLASAGDRRRRRSLEEGYYYCEEYHPTYCPLDCQNGGACVVFNNKYIRHHHHHHHHRRSLDQEEEYYCSCTEGYNGYLCQDDIIYKDECTLECQNGGTCEFNDDDDDDDDDDDAWDDEILGPNNHVCVCPGGYYGQVCEHHHLAAGKPCGCQNGGQCFVVSEEESSTAIGTLCQYESTSVCQNNNNGGGGDPRFCVNGGLCLDASKGTCECPTGFYGSRCEFNQEEKDMGLADCELQCSNGGTCSKGISSVPPVLEAFAGVTAGSWEEAQINFESCICLYGFYGVQCEKEYAVCGETEHVCLHGGKCVESVSSYWEWECNCSETDFGASGRYCATIMPTRYPTSSPTRSAILSSAPTILSSAPTTLVDDELASLASRTEFRLVYILCVVTLVF